MPDNVPMFPGATLLGSRDWTSDERTPGGMGEWDGPQTFDKGEMPMIRPEVRAVGNLDCIERGGGGDVFTHDDTFDRWLPAGCYEPLTGSPCERIFRCPDMAQITAVMNLVNAFPSIGLAQAQLLVGAGSVATLFAPPPGGRFSASIVCVLGNEAWQFIDGTRNAGQLLTQATDTALGPSRYGRYRVSQIYEDYAAECLQRFSAAGAGACRRFVLVGHSYGGAAAAVAAARLRLMDANIQVALFTLGAPRAGNQQLIDVLKNVCQTHIRRPYDPIPYLPPQLTWWHLNPIGLSLWPFFRIWGEYATYDYRRVLDGATLREEQAGDGPDNGNITSILTALATNVALDNFEDHDLSAYAADFAAHCGTT